MRCNNCALAGAATSLVLLTSLGGPFKDMAEFAVYGTSGATPDTTPPETTLTGAFSFTSEPGATFECKLDTAPYAACSFQ